MVEVEDLVLSALGELVAKPAINSISFQTLNVNRLNHIYLFLENQPEHYRYRLTVVDRPVIPTSNLSHVSAVVLVPAGREGEYIFSSQKGLLQLAESANCARVIAVSFGRHHAFESQTAVQDELAYVVQTLSQQGRFLPPILLKQHTHNLSIPFMALDGIGSRNVLAEGDTSMSGKYLIEQVRAGNRIVRRLYFMSNPFVIQSEVAIREDIVDRSFLAFDYHKHMAAGVLALSSMNEVTPTGMVIGLGGGGLVNFLIHVLENLYLTVVELDESVVKIAEKYFGYEPTEKVSTRIGDGLSVTGDMEYLGGIHLPLASLDFIAIDVDSKDSSVGMSCPPVTFVDHSYLSTLKGLLRENGLLVINVSARDPEMFKLVETNVRNVFKSVFLSSGDTDDDKQDVNLVVFAMVTSVELPSNMQLNEMVQKYLKPFTLFNGETPDWKETLCELEDCLTSICISSTTDIHNVKEKTTHRKKGNHKSGGRKKGKRK